MDILVVGLFFGGLHSWYFPFTTIALSCGLASVFLKVALKLIVTSSPVIKRVFQVSGVILNLDPDSVSATAL